MQLVTGANERYFDRIQPYLDSLDHHADFGCTFIEVGFFRQPPYRAMVKTMCLPETPGSPIETQCIQHGSFLERVPGPLDEVVIYTDGDFVMQRPMDDEERAFLDLKPGEVCTGYNFGPQSTLYNDGLILHPLRSMDAIAADWGEELVRTAQDWNVGFLAMTRVTWWALYRAYLADWERVCATFGHMARQQWLISYEIARMGLNVKICPWSIHAHGHGGLKPGMAYGPDGMIYVGGKLALFRHYL